VLCDRCQNLFQDRQFTDGMTKVRPSRNESRVHCFRRARLPIKVAPLYGLSSPKNERARISSTSTAEELLTTDNRVFIEYQLIGSILYDEDLPESPVLYFDIRRHPKYFPYVSQAYRTFVLHRLATGVPIFMYDSWSCDWR